ncbi:hypothetical protein QR680_006931 [Steinernema hermaphroditum]|uniref:Uncharacterized protein n=1 Tax=Steinernema hermaphroditum TaxID=289476 RepID=A0AA39HX06_9BILA|nr:hypothetical protein QR680_006931 [Steinernema hermaphroditum]
MADNKKTVDKTEINDGPSQPSGDVTKDDKKQGGSRFKANQARRQRRNTVVTSDDIEKALAEIQLGKVKEHTADAAIKDAKTKEK